MSGACGWLKWYSTRFESLKVYASNESLPNIISTNVARRDLIKKMVASSMLVVIFFFDTSLK